MSKQTPIVTPTADAGEAARLAAETLAAALDSARAERGIAHGALAGGTTPRRAYELLGGLLGDWSGIHLWFGDERCLPPEDPESNFHLVREALHAPGVKIHRIRGELGAEAAAAAYTEELGELIFDIALLGLGEDGHTASLFPHHPQLRAAGAAVPVHNSPKPPPDRVSITLERLNESRRILLLVTGAGKADALGRVLADPPDEGTPASLLDRARLEIVADADALRDG
jgi:6-phosphogluconolactonase